MKDKPDFAARHATYQKLPLATLLPQAIALRLRDAALSGAYSDSATVSKRIDSIVLELEAREPGKFFQSAQIDFLKNPYSVIAALDKKRATAKKAKAEPKFTQGDSDELAQLFKQSEGA